MVGYAIWEKGNMRTEELTYYLQNLQFICRLNFVQYSNIVFRNVF